MILVEGYLEPGFVGRVAYPPSGRELRRRGFQEVAATLAVVTENTRQNSSYLAEKQTHSFVIFFLTTTL